MDESEDDPPLIIKRIDPKLLGTLAKQTNSWYEIEEKEKMSEEEEDENEVREEENEVREREPERESQIIDDIEINKKTINTLALGTFASEKNAWYETEEQEDGDEEEDEEEEENEDDEEDDDDVMEENISALQLMNCNIEELVDTTNDVESILRALLLYSQTLQDAVQKRLETIHQTPKI